MKIFVIIVCVSFLYNAGRIYRPNIIRVSAMETSVSSSVYPRLLPVLVQEYSNMTHAVWQSKCEEIGCKISQAITEARIMEESLQGQRMSLEVAQVRANLVVCIVFCRLYCISIFYKKMGADIIELFNLKLGKSIF